MPRPRFERLEAEKQAAILDSALEAFAAHGFEGASYNQIIERTGISKGAMYYYFDDKEDLFATVVERELAGVGELMSNLPEIGSVEEYWAMLGHLVTRFVAFATERPLTMALFRQVYRLKVQGIRSLVVKRSEGVGQAWTAEILAVGRGVGAVRSDIPDELMVAIINAVDEAGDTYAMTHLDELGQDAIRQWGEVFIDLLRRMVAPRVIFPDPAP